MFGQCVGWMSGLLAVCLDGPWGLTCPGLEHGEFNKYGFIANGILSISMFPTFVKHPLTAGHVQYPFEEGHQQAPQVQDGEYDSANCQEDGSPSRFCLVWDGQGGFSALH